MFSRSASRPADLSHGFIVEGNGLSAHYPASLMRGIIFVATVSLVAAVICWA